MGLIIRCWKKLLYLLVTGSTSVFIAACYGMPAEFVSLGSWTIKVRNEDNEPIRGLEVIVLQYSGGAVTPDTFDVQLTDSSGNSLHHLSAFDQNVSHRHEALISDIDGEENGGAYSDTLIARNGSEETSIILRDKQ